MQQNLVPAEGANVSPNKSAQQFRRGDGTPKAAEKGERDASADPLRTASSEAAEQDTTNILLE